MNYDLPPGTHDRWGRRVHRDAGSPSYREAWYSQQCGGCRFWMPLAAPAGHDWGVCANTASDFDGVVRFEHDGCEAFTEDADGWRIP